jgi:hypothetical protein
MFERNVLKGPILMGSPIVEMALGYTRAHGASEFNSSIRTKGVIDVNVIAPT